MKREDFVSFLKNKILTKSFGGFGPFKILMKTKHPVTGGDWHIRSGFEINEFDVS